MARRIGTQTKTNASAAATQPSSDFFVGEAKVDVTKDETVVRLAMAQHGSVLIELPANDGPRYIIPGDPEMATVDEKAHFLFHRQPTAAHILPLQR
jgi:phage terminase large subunit GpA-like protein